MIKKDQSFKGFETWFTAIRMHLKMYLHIGIAILAVQVIITLALSYTWYAEAWREIASFGWESLVAFNFGYIQDYVLPAIEILLRKSLGIFILSFALWIIYPSIVAKFKKRSESQSAVQHIRGSKLISPEQLIEAIRRDGERVDIPIGSVRMPVAAEPKHAFIVGRPGVGKTVAMSQVIARLRDRDAKSVVYDFKGDYLCKFYDNERDILFNPLDMRCYGWNLFNEIETYMDIDSIATSLIPHAVSNADPFWNDAARDVFSGILHYLYQTKARTNADIWKAVTAPKQDVADWLSGTRGGERGYRYIEDASSKQALSVFAVLMQYVKSFEYMSKLDGTFSLKQWLENNKGGFIFITSYADIKDTLRPILSLFVDLLGRKLLSMKDDYDRRIFFMLDEFGTLQRLSTITNLLTLSRSKGGSCWIGIQDTGQLDKIYTHHTRQTIVNACGTNLIFSVADPETARFLSDKIGDHEYSEIEETLGMGVENNRDGISLMRRKRTDKLVLPSEIQNLRDLAAYLKFPNYDVANIQLQYKKYENRAEPFLCRDDLNLANIVREQEELAREVRDIAGDRGKEIIVEKRIKETGKRQEQERDELDEYDRENF
jgi:type IV conjugative transfer system coupling protein TraD